MIRISDEDLNQTIEIRNGQRDKGTLNDYLCSIEHRCKALQNEIDQNATGVSPVKTMRNVLQQIQNARNDALYQISVASDFTRIQISNFSNYGSSHFMDMRVVDASEVSDMQVVRHSLPLPDSIEQSGVGFHTAGSIQSHIAMFQLYMEQLETFYENMNTIDEMCFVVHPIKITTKSVQRTFKIETNIYIQIIVNPLAPHSIETTIIGPSYAIGKYRDLYDARIRDWDTNVDIHKNLLAIFDLPSFPMKDQLIDEANEAGCGICLNFRNNRQVPIVSCDNTKCHIVFHTSCLRTWFEAQPDSRTFLNVTFGSCPYCKEKMSTTFVSLLVDAS